MARLYRFVNCATRERGATFWLCDDCRRDQEVPDGFVLEMVIDRPMEQPCEHCGERPAALTAS